MVSSQARKTESVVSPSFFAPDLVVRGRVRTTGAVRIDGVLDGDIDAHRLEVGPRGHLRATITAEAAVIGGTVSGVVKARALTFIDGCRFSGDAQYESLAAEPEAGLECTLHPVLAADARTYVGARSLTVSADTLQGVVPAPAPLLRKAAEEPSGEVPFRAGSPSSSRHAETTAASWSVERNQSVQEGRSRSSARVLLLSVGFLAILAAAAAFGVLIVNPAVRGLKSDLVEAVKQGRDTPLPAPLDSSPSTGSIPAPTVEPSATPSSDQGGSISVSPSVTLPPIPETHALPPPAALLPPAPPKDAATDTMPQPSGEPAPKAQAPALEPSASLPIEPASGTVPPEKTLAPPVLTPTVVAPPPPTPEADLAKETPPPLTTQSPAVTPPSPPLPSSGNADKSGEALSQNGAKATAKPAKASGESGGENGGLEAIERTEAPAPKTAKPAKATKTGGKGESCRWVRQCTEGTESEGESCISVRQCGPAAP